MHDDAAVHPLVHPSDKVARPAPLLGHHEELGQTTFVLNSLISIEYYLIPISI